MFEELKDKYSLGDECIGELEKVLQSETDKVRTKYAGQIKELEKFKPQEKTEQQVEFENTQKELNELKFKLSMKEKGLDESFSKFLKPDANLDEFSNMFNGIAQSKKDYVANNHPANKSMTKEQFNKLGYEEKAKLYAENPTLYAELRK